MVDELIEMYHDGAITGYQVVLDSLRLLDCGHPDLVLSRLPNEILAELSQYVDRFDPSAMRSLGAAPPTVDQVKSARRWIEEQKTTPKKMASS